MAAVLRRSRTAAMANFRRPFFSHPGCNDPHLHNLEKSSNANRSNESNAEPAISTPDTCLSVSADKLAPEALLEVGPTQNVFQLSIQSTLPASSYTPSLSTKVYSQAEDTVSHSHQESSKDAANLNSCIDPSIFEASKIKHITTIDGEAQSAHNIRGSSEEDIKSQCATTLTSISSSSQISTGDITPGTSYHESFGSSPIPSQLVARRNPYRLSKNVFQAVNTYPCSGSEIPVEHKLSFDTVVDCLYQNLENHRQPISARQPIEINLWMTGTSKDDAKPSIVVTCDKDALPHVESVLSSSHIQNQHNLVILKRLGWRSSWKWQLPSKDLYGNRPRYYLCFRARDEARIQYRGHILRLDIQFEGTETNFWCGSKIYQPQRSSRATLSCILRVGQDMYGLTTAHSFRSASNSYEESEEFKSVALSDKIPRKVLIPETNVNDTKIPDLDWALITMNDTPITSSCPGKGLGSVVDNQPSEERDVLILSSVTAEAKEGILLCGTTATKVNLDTERVHFWSVELMYDQALQKGDSGSLVIDALTRDVYGYVVARDSYGLIQIVPIHAAIKQIQQIMDITEISMLQSIDTNLASWSTALGIRTLQEHSSLPTAHCEEKVESPAIVRQSVEVNNVWQPDIRFTTNTSINLNSPLITESVAATISQSYEEDSYGQCDDPAVSVPSVSQKQAVKPTLTGQDYDTFFERDFDMDASRDVVMNTPTSETIFTANSQQSREDTRDDLFRAHEPHKEHDVTKPSGRLQAKLGVEAVDSTIADRIVRPHTNLTSNNVERSPILGHVSRTMPYPSFPQVDRWQAHSYSTSNHERRSTAWTLEDDDQLMHLRTQGMNWGPIATRFPGKTPNACRKRHERLMEKKNAESWDDGIKIEDLSRAYLQVREQMWKILAETLGEKWQTVETKCMEKGLKTLTTAGRAARRLDITKQVTPGTSHLSESEFNDSRVSPPITSGARSSPAATTDPRLQYSLPSAHYNYTSATPQPRYENPMTSFRPIMYEQPPQSNLRARKRPLDSAADSKTIHKRAKSSILEDGNTTNVEQGPPNSPRFVPLKTTTKRALESKHVFRTPSARKTGIGIKV